LGILLKLIEEAALHSSFMNSETRMELEMLVVSALNMSGFKFTKVGEGNEDRIIEIGKRLMKGKSKGDINGTLL